MHYNQKKKKKRQKTLVNGHGCGFLPLIFPSKGHLEHYAPLKQHVILIENKALYFSKRALRTGAAHNK